MAKEIFTGSNGIVSKVPVHLLIKSTWFPTWTWIEFVGFYSQGIWTYMEGVSIMPKKICSWYAAQQRTNTKWSYFANIEEISYLLREDFFLPTEMLLMFRFLAIKEKTFCWSNHQAQFRKQRAQSNNWVNTEHPFYVSLSQY